MSQHQYSNDFADSEDDELFPEIDEEDTPKNSPESPGKPDQSGSSRALFRWGIGTVATILAGTVTAVIQFSSSDPSSSPVRDIVQPGQSEIAEAVGDFGSVDVERVSDTTRDIARDRWSDAKVLQLTAQNVSPDGTADLTLGSSDVVSVIYGSQTEAERAESRPVGASGNEVPCLYFTITPGRIDRQVRTDLSSCVTPSLDPEVPDRPRCSVSEVWDRAIDEGAPSENAVGLMSYTAEEQQWAFTVGDTFATVISDDCSR